MHYLPPPLQSNPHSSYGFVRRVAVASFSARKYDRMNFFFYIEQATTKLHIKPLRRRIVVHSIMCHAQGT